MAMNAIKNELICQPPSYLKRRNQDKASKKEPMS